MSVASMELDSYSLNYIPLTVLEHFSWDIPAEPETYFEDDG